MGYMESEGGVIERGRRKMNLHSTGCGVQKDHHTLKETFGWQFKPCYLAMDCYHERIKLVLYLFM